MHHMLRLLLPPLLGVELPILPQPNVVSVSARNFPRVSLGHVQCQIAVVYGVAVWEQLAVKNLPLTGATCTWLTLKDDLPAVSARYAATCPLLGTEAVCACTDACVLLMCDLLAACWLWCLCGLAVQLPE